MIAAALSAIRQNAFSICFYALVMTFDLTFQRALYDYLRISASQVGAGGRNTPYVAIHLNYDSFIGSLESANLNPSTTKRLAAAASTAWQQPDSVVMFKDIQLTSVQCSHLRLVPHRVCPKDTVTLAEELFQ
jgi:hypothetical protein